LETVATGLLRWLCGRHFRSHRGSPGNCRNFIHNPLNGASTSTALPGVAQAGIDLAYTRRPNRPREGGSDFILAEHVAGADDHQSSPQSSLAAAAQVAIGSLMPLTLVGSAIFV